MFVITGGSQGIGAALALNLARHTHHQVLIIGRNQAHLNRIATHHSHIKTCQADVSTPSGRDNMLQALASCEHIDALVHNAGVIEPIAPIKTLPAHAWEHILQVNLSAPFFLTQALYTKLIGGRVLHIGSGAAYFPIQGWAPYCVSKAGLSMLSRMWHLECPEIASASVMPGIVATDMQAAIRHAAHQHPDKKQFFQDLYDKHQLITPETVASFLTWLLITIDKTRFVSQEWDIYDTSHHTEWLEPPQQVVPIHEGA